MRDRAAAHEQCDIPPSGLLFGQHPHRRDAGPARDKQQVPRRALDHERRPERPEQIEPVTLTSRSDPFAAGTQRLDDELDLAPGTVDAVERIRSTQQRIERWTGADMHELTGTRLARDAWRGDTQDRTELSDLGRRDDPSVLEDHSGTPTAKV